MYEVVYTRRAAKSLKKIPRIYQIKIKFSVDNLSKNPLSAGTIKLANYPYAQYRKRCGDSRILFDIDEDNKKLIIADIRRRSSTTYS